MNTMEGGRQSFFTEWKPKLQRGRKRGKFSKGKPLQHSDEIVISKGTSVETMPSLSKRLEGITIGIIGLCYVWEYRSPSRSVPPFYHCEVCNVHLFQDVMVDHIAGWKHALRYIKKEHSDKITVTEEEAMKDPAMKKNIRDVTAELVSTEGRGQIKVILKEPANIPAFKGLLISKGTSTETMTSLSKRLKGVTFCVIGLQYVWEYRSPRRSVPPFYHCEVCNVHQSQERILAHLAGWKHAFRYIKKEHSDKITFIEEEAMKDSTMKKIVKDVAAELARTEGRGQINVILKEPADVPAFKGLLSPLLKQIQKEESFAHMPPQGGYRSDGFGGYASLPPPRDYNVDHGQYCGMGHNSERSNYEGSEQGGPPADYPPRYREGPVNPLKRPRGNDEEDLYNTLLGYLDTFKIENESDAQLVLKVTQKLTDILMEYRLRSVPKSPSMPPGYRSPPPKMPKFNEQYSEYQGPPRYSGSPSRFED